jgi:hypothetical protein
LLYIFVFSKSVFVEEGTRIKKDIIREESKIVLSYDSYLE